MAKLTAGLLGYTQGAVAGVQAQKLRGEIILRKRQPSIPTKTEAQRVYRSRWGSWQRLQNDIAAERNMRNEPWGIVTKEVKRGLFLANTQAESFVGCDYAAWRDELFMTTGRGTIGFADSGTTLTVNFPHEEYPVEFYGGVSVARVIWTDGSMDDLNPYDVVTSNMAVEGSFEILRTGLTPKWVIIDSHIEVALPGFEIGVRRFVMKYASGANNSLLL